MHPSFHRSLSRRSASHLPRAVVVVVACAVQLAAGSAQAATQTLSMGVTTVIPTSCAVSGGTYGLPLAASMNFGTRDVLASSPATAQTPSSGLGVLQVLCTATGLTPTLTLNTGLNPGGSSLRRLSGPSGTLVDYALYHDSAKTQPVDANPFALPALTVGTPYTLVLYGRLPTPSQANVAGSYVDTVSLTITY